jgi:hypothetical protein
MRWMSVRLGIQFGEVHSTKGSEWLWWGTKG